MKKLFTIISLLTLAITANATDYTKLDTSADNVLYIEATVQTNATGVLNVYMKSKTDVVGTVDFQFFLPDGFTLINTDTQKASMASGVTGSYSIYPNQPDGSIKNAISQMNWAASDEAKLVATIPVEVTAPMGTYNINAIQYHMVNLAAADITKVNNVYTEVAVQRAAVINSMTVANNIEIIPLKMTANTTNNIVSLLMTNTNAIGKVAFDMYLPNGISWTLDGTDYSEAELDNYNAEPNQDISKNNDGSIHVEFSRSASKYYFNAGLSKATIAKIQLDVASNLADGVYTIKLKNIELDEKNTDGSYTGDYYFSVFVGTPTETDPVVYGHYTTEGQAALKAAAKNFASIDMSAATVDAAESAVASDLSEKLIYGPAKTSYNREVTGYGTVCLPFELTSGNGAQYYTVESATDNSITFKAASTVAANTPAIVKGTVNASVEGYQYASEAGTATTVNGLTLTGTYASYALESGKGYYIANDAFYGDGATVAPFRAYFAGSVSGSKLSIFIDDATGLHEITDQLSDEDIYNLQGMKLNKTRKGVNIIGGKKILVK